MDEQLLRVIEKSDVILETATKLGVAYMGYKSNKDWSGALTALIAFKLAQSGNVVAGAAGVGVLALIGATQIPTIPGVDPIPWSTFVDPSYYDVHTRA